MTTATKTDLNPTQQQALEAFTSKLLGRLGDSLRMLLGRELTMGPGDVAILDGADIRMRLPASAAGLSVDLEGADAPVLALLELPLALSLAHLARMGAQEELETLRDSPPSPTNDDLEQLRTTSSFFAAALIDLWPGSEPGESSEVVLLQDGAWQPDQHPLGEGDYLHVEAHCSLGELTKDTFSLFIPLSVAEILVPVLAQEDSTLASKSESQTLARGRKPNTPGPQAGPTAEVDTTPTPARRATNLGQPNPVVCIDADTVADRGASILESGTVERLSDVGSLEAWLQKGHVPALVIARIAGGTEDDLDELARLTRDHPLREYPVMVLLENPVKRTVLRCGRLGLVNVLPDQAHPDVAWRRVALWLRRRAVTA